MKPSPYIRRAAARLILASIALALAKTASAGSATEVACPHTTPATSTDPASLLATDIPAGAPLPYVPYELSNFPVADWRQVPANPNTYTASRILSTGVLSTDMIRVPLTYTQRAGGRIVSPDSVLVNACEYYSTLNGYESYLNSLGMTTTDNTPRYHVRETVTTSDELNTWNGQVQLNQQVTDTSAGAANVASELRTEITNRYAALAGPNGTTQGQQDQNAGLGISAFNATNGGTVDFKTLHSYKRSRTCPLQEFGFKNKFYASIECSNSMNYWDPAALRRIDNGEGIYGNYRNQKGYATKVESSIQAKGSVFGLEFDILDTSIVGRTYHDGSVDAKVSGKLMGFDLFAGAAGQMKRNTLKLAKSSSAEAFNLEESVQTTVVIGPVPVSLEVGARAEGAIDYTYALAGLKADAAIAPNLLVEGFAVVGVDLLVVGASVEANLVVIDENLESGGHIKVADPQGAATPYIEAMGSIYNSMEVISGNINLITWIMVPRLAWAPFQKKEFEYTLFDWNGLVSQGSLFSADERFELYQ